MEQAARGLATSLWIGGRLISISLLVYTKQPLPARLFLKKRRTSLLFPARSRSENAFNSGGEALAAAKLRFQFFFFDHPDLQLHLDDFKRADVPGGGVQGGYIDRRKLPRGKIEDMRSAAAKFCEQGMRSSSELEPHRNQGTVNLDANVAGKLKHEASCTRLNVRAAADPSATIGNEPAEPGYDCGLVFSQQRR
jgi:hypothetical protein